MIIYHSSDDSGDDEDVTLAPALLPSPSDHCCLPPSDHIPLGYSHDSLVSAAAATITTTSTTTAATATR